jgi:hypothetical protein
MPLQDDYDYSQDDLDNHANQLNPNNDLYNGPSRTKEPFGLKIGNKSRKLKKK